MTATQDVLIKEIAVKHGVVIGRDDPILILQTLNAQLMEEAAIAQQRMLDNYKEELEGIALRWGNDAKDKSERILNASLAASKDAMAKLLQESANTTAITIKQEIDKSLSRISTTLLDTKRVAMLNLIASSITLFAACTAIIGVFFR